MKHLASLSILCLAYNEEDNVCWALPQIAEEALRVTDDYEIVVVTNAQSTDHTNEILAQMSQHDSRIRPVTQPAGSRGYGPAFAFGLTQVTKEYTFHVDIDGQFLFSDLAKAVRLLETTNADLVHFNREKRKDPLERKIIGFFFKLLVHSLYICPVWDFDSAFNLFRTAIAQSIRLRSNSGMAVPEFMIQMRQNGASIAVGATQHQPRRAGKPTWEVTSKVLILPDPHIVGANLSDLWRLRSFPGSRFCKSTYRSRK